MTIKLLIILIMTKDAKIIVDAYKNENISHRMDVAIKGMYERFEVGGAEALTVEDLTLLYELDENIHPDKKYGYYRVSGLREEFRDERLSSLYENRDIITDLTEITGFTEEQIMIDPRFHRDDPGIEDQDIRYADAIRYNGSDTSEVQLYFGNLYYDVDEGLFNSSRHEFYRNMPSVVLGNVQLDADFTPSEHKLPNAITGDLILFGLTKSEGLELPEKVRGTVYVNSMGDEEMSKLKERYLGLNIRNQWDDCI